MNTTTLKTPTTHPTLRSLWNIPHIIRIPDPMPPAPEVLQIIQQRIAERQIEKRTLDPHLRDYQDRIAEPAPIGFGVKTSQPSLYRFKTRLNQAKEKSQKAQHAKAIDDLLANANSSDEAFQSAIQRSLKVRLLTTTIEPNANLDTIDALITSLTKLRKQSLAERRQAHAEKTKNQTGDDK